MSISSTEVSRAAEKRDGDPRRPARTPLDESPTLFFDARYDRVREAGQLVACAVLTVLSIMRDGQRRVLGVSAARSEAEVHWCAFFDGLIRRGLTGPK